MSNQGELGGHEAQYVEIPVPDEVADTARDMASTVANHAELDAEKLSKLVESIQLPSSVIESLQNNLLTLSPSTFFDQLDQADSTYISRRITPEISVSDITSLENPTYEVIEQLGILIQAQNKHIEVVEANGAASTKFAKRATTLRSTISLKRIEAAETHNGRYATQLGEHRSRIGYSRLRGIRI